MADSFSSASSAYTTMEYFFSWKSLKSSVGVARRRHRSCMMINERAIANRNPGLTNTADDVS
ncbi:hypothetical protein [Nostoc sp.]|uniref:hypothetical protein n=1 Tax=Nostoc sp. TaxID=1180 RepID=UPI002FF250CE